MPQKLTLEDARESLTAHVAARGCAIREKYGPAIGWAQLQRMLADRECVRYPCELVFDAEALQPGECAYPLPLGNRPEDGFRLCLHPYFSTDPTRVPLLVLYQLVVINYGAFASSDDAEAFGAAVLGLSPENYYAALCAMADEIAPEGSSPAGAEVSPCACGGHGSAVNSCAHLDKECAAPPAMFCENGSKENLDDPDLDPTSGNFFP